MKKEIIEILKALVGTDFLYFDEPVVIKFTPHMPANYLWGLSVQHGRLWIMDAEEDWYEVNEKHEADRLVINSLYQRIKLIEQQLLIK